MRRCHEKLVLLDSDRIFYNKQERSDIKCIEQAGIVLLARGFASRGRFNTYMHCAHFDFAGRLRLTT